MAATWRARAWQAGMKAKERGCEGARWIISGKFLKDSGLYQQRAAGGRQLCLQDGEEVFDLLPGGAVTSWGLCLKRCSLLPLPALPWRWGRLSEGSSGSKTLASCLSRNVYKSKAYNEIPLKEAFLIPGVRPLSGPCRRAERLRVVFTSSTLLRGSRPSDGLKPPFRGFCYVCIERFPLVSVRMGGLYYN